jgi:hypothetical protein
MRYKMTQRRKCHNHNSLKLDCPRMRYKMSSSCNLLWLLALSPI